MNKYNKSFDVVFVFWIVHWTLLVILSLLDMDRIAFIFLWFTGFYIILLAIFFVILLIKRVKKNKELERFINK